MYDVMKECFQGITCPLIGGVVTDQAEADEDTSIKNRALMAIGESYIIHDMSTPCQRLQNQRTTR